MSCLLLASHSAHETSTLTEILRVSRPGVRQPQPNLTTSQVRGAAVGGSYAHCPRYWITTRTRPLHNRESDHHSLSLSLSHVTLHYWTIYFHLSESYNIPLIQLCTCSRISIVFSSLNQFSPANQTVWWKMLVLFVLRQIIV